MLRLKQDVPLGRTRVLYIDTLTPSIELQPPLTEYEHELMYKPHKGGTYGYRRRNSRKL